MSDLIRRAARVLTTLDDSSLAKHEQMERAMESFNGLMLSDLHPDIREHLLDNLGCVMAVTQAYDFQENESPARMDEKDIDRCLAILQIASDDAIEAECKRLINELDQATSALPIAAITSIREHRDFMIPWLIGCIEETADQLRSASNVEIGQASFFSLFLLSEFDIQEALPVIIDALQTPDLAPFEMFGDAISETLSTILAQLANPSLESLMPLIDNRKANRYVRIAAVGAYYYALLARVIERPKFLDMMQVLLHRACRENDADLATGVVCCLCDAGATELLGDITSAYKAQLINTSVVSLRSVVASEIPPELLDSTGPKPQLGISDCLRELSKWDCFRPAPNPTAESQLSSSFPL